MTTEDGYGAGAQDRDRALATASAARRVAQRQPLAMGSLRKSYSSDVYRYTAPPASEQNALLLGSSSSAAANRMVQAPIVSFDPLTPTADGLAMVAAPPGPLPRRPAPGLEKIKVVVREVELGPPLGPAITVGFLSLEAYRFITSLQVIEN